MRVGYPHALSRTTDRSTAWWLLAVGFAVSMLAAFGFYLGWSWGIEPLWLRLP